MSEIYKDSYGAIGLDRVGFTPEEADRYLRVLLDASLDRSAITNIVTVDVVKKIVLGFIQSYKGMRLEYNIQVEDSTNIVVVGDIHGNMQSLSRIIKDNSERDPLYIFLGDYVDKNLRGVQVMLTLMLLKQTYIQNIFMLRGNHEHVDINKNLGQYGFLYDCIQYYGDSGEEVFNIISTVYDYLPISLILNKKFYFVHGGIPEDLATFNATVNRATPYHIDNLAAYQALWNDPDVKYPDSNYDVTIFRDSRRGPGIKRFGRAVTAGFLQAKGCKCIIRGHQFDRDEPIFVTPDYKIITVFSSCNYCGAHNDGAYLIINTYLTSTKINTMYIKYDEDDSDDDDDSDETLMEEEEDDSGYDSLLREHNAMGQAEFGAIITRTERAFTGTNGNTVIDNKRYELMQDINSLIWRDVSPVVQDRPFFSNDGIKKMFMNGF